MRLLVFSKFWLSQLQRSVNVDVKTLVGIFPKRKYLVSAQTFSWASGTLLGFASFFFWIKNILLYYDFNFKFNSRTFQYTNPILFLDIGFYFSTRMASWGFSKDDIFLRAAVGGSSVKYITFGTTLHFFFKLCTSYRFVDLLSRATINSLPAFDVFWNCFISVNTFSSNSHNFCLIPVNYNSILLKQAGFFLACTYLH